MFTEIGHTPFRPTTTSNSMKMVFPQPCIHNAKYVHKLIKRTRPYQTFMQTTRGQLHMKDLIIKNKIRTTFILTVRHSFKISY